MSPSALPEGAPAPDDGRLPAEALAGAPSKPFGVYVHVPFCATRCGYCDFNTYTAGEAGSTTSAAWLDAVLSEIALAARVLADVPDPGIQPASTVFFGGGTPTLLPPGDLATVLASVRDELGLAPSAEVTTEANPESVGPAELAALRAAGFNRVSFGMQSARPHVLAQLDRVHTPGRVRDVVQAARAAGFDSVSVDLIYGTPGESAADWQASLDEAVGLGVDHVSAYALVVEPGTRLAARVRRGDIEAPDDDVLAERYVQADETLGAAGLAWYEVSNWATGPDQRARHNLGYWTGASWWGLGPGAHSHVSGTRWWNVKHPAAYAQRLSAGLSPAAAREVLDASDRHVEDVLLRIRLADGLPLDVLRPRGRAAAERAVADALLDQSAATRGIAVLTRRGRLLADAVVRDLVD